MVNFLGQEKHSYKKFAMHARPPFENIQKKSGFCWNYNLPYLCANQANGKNPSDKTPKESSLFRVAKRSGDSVARPLLALVHP